MEVRNVTHLGAVWASPDDPIAEVAAVMRAADVSAVLAGEDYRVIGMNECSQQRPEEYPDSPPPPPEYPFRHPDERPDQSPIEKPPPEPGTREPHPAVFSRCPDGDGYRRAARSRSDEPWPRRMPQSKPEQSHPEWFENNQIVAAALRQAAGLLRAQDASPFRSQAYLKAASTIDDLNEDIAAIAARGAAALDALPHIGIGIASAIQELLATGKWSQLDRLRGEIEPEATFRSVPGVGPVLAERIHEHLHVDTLEALEAAAHDGRLSKVPGIGPRRAAIIRDALTRILGRRRPIAHRLDEAGRPPVEMILDVDREYRNKAEAGELRQIAPRRFNPQARAWLPILHTERGEWHFTALYSNTARAHQLGRTRDWVVIFYASDHQTEDQCTVVTETSGPMKGQRVVRGRERESAARGEAAGSAAGL